MSILESTLIVIGLSMNIFLIGQYEGSMIRKIEWRAVFVVCLIVGVFETFAMLGGYLLTRIPFFSLSESADLKHFCCFVAAILFLLIASYMLYKAFRHAPVQERLNKIAYKRILLEVVLVAVFRLGIYRTQYYTGDERDRRLHSSCGDCGDLGRIQGRLPRTLWILHDRRRNARVCGSGDTGAVSVERQTVFSEEKRRKRLQIPLKAYILVL